MGCSLLLDPNPRKGGRDGEMEGRKLLYRGTCFGLPDLQARV